MEVFFAYCLPLVNIAMSWYESFTFVTSRPSGTQVMCKFTLGSDIMRLYMQL